MRKTLAALAACAGLFAGASAAHADSFTPGGSTFTFSGPVVYTDGFPISCTLNLVIVSNAAGTDASVVSATLGGGGFCGAVATTWLPWNIDVVATPPSPVGLAVTRLAFTGVRIVGVATICGTGTIQANWTVGPAATITFPTGMKLTPPTPGCGIVGTLTQVGGPPLVITD